MDNYILSESAKADLIRIHQYGLKIFGASQADKYFNQFFENFESISKNTYTFESVDYIKQGYRRCLSGAESIYFRVNETQEMAEIMTIIGVNNWRIYFRHVFIPYLINSLAIG